MDTNLAIIEINKLIETGNDVLSKKGANKGDGWYAFNPSIQDTVLATKWMTTILSFIFRYFGEDSFHYKEATKFNQGMYGLSNNNAKQTQGMLEGIKYDIENGYLETLENEIILKYTLDLINVDVNAENYKFLPSLFGAILECRLREMCERREGCEIIGHGNLGKYNNKLYSKGVYVKSVMKLITAYGDIRNASAHGNWDDITENDANNFKSWLINFLSTYN